jgi:hypothetical protein
MDEQFLGCRRLLSIRQHVGKKKVYGVQVQHKSFCSSMFIRLSAQMP